MDQDGSQCIVTCCCSPEFVVVCLSRHVIIKAKWIMDYLLKELQGRLTLI